MNLDHIAFNVTDIARSVQWYEKNLNCEVIYRDDTWAMIKCADVKIALVTSSEHPPHIAFEVSSSMTLPCDDEKIGLHRDGSSYYYGSDPDGNVIEWVAYADSDE